MGLFGGDEITERAFNLEKARVLEEKSKGAYVQASNAGVQDSQGKTIFIILGIAIALGVGFFILNKKGML